MWSSMHFILLSFAMLILVLTSTTGQQAPQVGGQEDGDLNTKDPNKPRFLSLPNPGKCSRRPKEFFYGGHWYFYSGNVTELRGKDVDWLEARNICRFRQMLHRLRLRFMEHCMDAVSLETDAEHAVITGLMRDSGVQFVWTSGRLCDFKGCFERQDLQPLNIRGWFWSGSGTKMGPTNETTKGWTHNPWGQTGHKSTPQPDNAEVEINGTPESCLAILNGVYPGDGVSFHDVACYHEKPFFCEDSEELLKFTRSTNPHIPI